MNQRTADDDGEWDWQWEDDNEDNHVADNDAIEESVAPSTTRESIIPVETVDDDSETPPMELHQDEIGLFQNFSSIGGDDPSHMEDIPLTAAVPLPNYDDEEPLQDDLFGNSETFAVASLVDTNDPGATRSFEEAPAASRATDASTIPKNGVGWVAGFRRDFVAHLPHMLLLLVGVFILCRNEWHKPGVIACWYAVFLLEAAFSSYGQALWNMSASSGVSDYLNQLRRSEPSLSLSMDCYHYQTRTVSYRDIEGKSQSRTETYKVVTFSVKEPVTILSCRDATQNFPTEADLKKCRLTKINLTKSFTADAPFKKQVNVLRMRYASRDLHYELKILYDIPSFIGYVMSRVDEDDNENRVGQFEVSWREYMLAHVGIVSALLYRLYVSARTSQRNVHIEKHILTAGPSPEALWELRTFNRMGFATTRS